MQDADGESKQLFQEFRDQDQQCVQRILQILPQKLGQGR
jgi:hypothetical protein